MEVETAVHLNLNLVHMAWIDGGYNVVAILEQTKVSANCRVRSLGR